MWEVAAVASATALGVSTAVGASPYISLVVALIGAAAAIVAAWMMSRRQTAAPRQKVPKAGWSINAQRLRKLEKWRLNFVNPLLLQLEELLAERAALDHEEDEDYEE